MTNLTDDGTGLAPLPEGVAPATWKWTWAGWIQPSADTLLFGTPTPDTETAETETAGETGESPVGDLALDAETLDPTPETDAQTEGDPDGTTETEDTAALEPLDQPADSDSDTGPDPGSGGLEPLFQQATTETTTETTAETTTNGRGAENKSDKSRDKKLRDDPPEEEPPSGEEPVVIEVSDHAGLMAALEGAQGGETILLAPGDYGTLDLWAGAHPWAVYDTPVTIASADPADPAVLTGLKLTAVANIVVDGLALDYDAAPGAVAWDRVFEIIDSRNITIRNSVFDGDLAEGVSALDDGYGTGWGLFVRWSDGILLEGNAFYDWGTALKAEDIDGLEIRGNEITRSSQDGIQLNGVRQTLIEDNHIHDFARHPDSTAHPDMIQIFSYNTAVPTHDVTIRGNLLMSGAGDWTQSIFLRNEAMDSGQADAWAYRNVLIEDNLIHNAHLHGISFGESEGLTIRQNTLLYNATAYDPDRAIFDPRIHALNDRSSDVAITGNIARAVPDPAAGWTVGNNLLVQRDDPDGANYYGDLFVNPFADAEATLADLEAIPGEVIDQGGYGAAVTRSDDAGALAAEPEFGLMSEADAGWL